MRGKGREEQTGKHTAESHVEKEWTESGLNAKKEGRKRSEKNILLCFSNIPFFLSWVAKTQLNH